jgi:hypothetical protein
MWLHPNPCSSWELMLMWVPFLNMRSYKLVFIIALYQITKSWIMLNLNVVRLSHPHESHFSRHHDSILYLNEDLCPYQSPLWNRKLEFSFIIRFCHKWQCYGVHSFESSSITCNVFVPNSQFSFNSFLINF